MPGVGGRGGGCGLVLGFKSSNCGHEGLPVECGYMS